MALIYGIMISAFSILTFLKYINQKSMSRVNSLWKAEIFKQILTFINHYIGIARPISGDLTRFIEVSVISFPGEILIIVNDLAS
jgi:hypothetical protein